MGFMAGAWPVFEAVGTVLGAVGSIVQGNAQASADRYQAQVAANNAIIAQQNAAYAVKAGEAATTQQQMAGAQREGAIKAAIAAGGVDVNKGSAPDVLAGQAETNQLDALTVRSNAQRQAYGYETEKTSFEAQQQLALSEASNAETAGWFGGVTSLLSGAGNIGANWQRWNMVAPGTPGTATAEADLALNPTVYNPYGGR